MASISIQLFARRQDRTWSGATLMKYESFQVQDLTEVNPGCFTFLVGKCLELPVVEDLRFLQCQL